MIKRKTSSIVQKIRDPSCLLLLRFLPLTRDTKLLIQNKLTKGDKYALYLAQTGPDVPVDTTLAQMYAYYRHPNTFAKYVHLCSMDEMEDSMWLACAQGNEDVVKILLDHDVVITASDLENVIRSGHLSCTILVYDNYHEKIDSEEVIGALLLSPDYTTIEWALDEQIVDEIMFAIHAVREGDIDCLEWLIEERHLELPSFYAQFAAHAGHLDILQMVYDANYDGDGEWDVFGNACLGGHVHILEWLHAQGCATGPNASSLAEKHGNVVLNWLVAHDRYIPSNLPHDVAVAEESLEASKWLYARGVIPEKYIMTFAYARLNLEYMEWLNSIGVKCCKMVINDIMKDFANGDPRADMQFMHFLVRVCSPAKLYRCAGLLAKNGSIITTMLAGLGVPMP